MAKGRTNDLEQAELPTREVVLRRLRGALYESWSASARPIVHVIRDCVMFDDAEIASALGDLFRDSYARVPGHGPGSPAIGNAAIKALAELRTRHAVAELVSMRDTMTYKRAQDAIERALDEVAERLGVNIDDLAEIAIPDFGADGDGTTELAFGDHHARLTLDDAGAVKTVYVKPDGSEQKSAPAALRRAHPDAPTEVKRTAAALRKTWRLQVQRLERTLALCPEWTLMTWRRRYLEHPLLASISRGLIWRFGSGPDAAAAMLIDGRWVDSELRAVTVDDVAVVSLWHPLGASREELAGWRERLSAEGIKQPFKQAFREIYELEGPEGERGADSSSRFAGIPLVQSRFAALTRARGWDYSLQGPWDSINTPRLALPHWGLRATFEALIGDESAPHGPYLHLLSGDVAFNGVPLADVPRVAFSEVMRDVDLFVHAARATS